MQNIGAIECLLVADTDVIAPDREGKTPLVVAVGEGDLKNYEYTY
jgi:hypothetical protein